MRVEAGRRVKTASWLLAILLLAPWPLRAEPLVLHRQIDRQQVTGGVELIRIRQFDSLGWLNIAALAIDHTDPDLRLDALLGNDRLTGSQQLSETAQQRGAVAGINGDFFHILTTNAPTGVHLQSGELFKSPPAERALATGFYGGRGSLPFIGKVSFNGRVASEDGATRQLSGWNEPIVPPHGLVYYNHRWDATAPGTDSPDAIGWQGIVHATLDANERVVQVLQGDPGPSIPENGAVLLGRGMGGAWLSAHAKPGQTVNVIHALSPEALVAAIGGRPLLIQNGELRVAPEQDIHPRSAVGFNADRTRSWWVVVDGRSLFSRGVSLHSMALIMQEFGAYDALNLDGGGSSTLLARTPGSDVARVQNLSSDGRERTLPNGLGIFHTAPTGSMHKLFIKQPAPRSVHTIEADELRLAPGSTFQPIAFATDENINPVALPAPVTWSVTPAELGSFSPEGIFSPSQPGRGEITAAVSASEETFAASLPVLVIDQPVGLELAPSELSLSPGQEVELAVSAIDARGFAAPLSAESVQWEVHGGTGQVVNGRFITGDSTGSGALHASFGNLRGLAPVGIGERPVLLAKFDGEGNWRTAAAPEETKSRLSSVGHLPFIRDSGPTAKLDYDFSFTDRIRAAYLRPESREISLPGRPLRLGLWVFGDGKEAWLRGQIADSTGTARAIDFARNIDWTGWRYIEAEIPPGTDYPISLRSIYVVETKPGAHYSGAIYLDELFAVHAPDIDPAFLTQDTKVFDPANRSVPLEKKDEDHYQFIVFGDSKVQANEPDSNEAKVLSALIEQINRHDVEFVLFTGDLMENDTEENYRFGKAFLDRLQKPYRTVIANHEIAGTDNYDRFRTFFGPTYTSFNRGNSEFILLNTARPGLRVSEEEQWPWLRKRLEEATADNLFILTHTPLIDPMPGGKTGWSDDGEIAIVQHLLAEQVEKDRNVYLFHGHVHGFDRRAHDGVQYLTSAGAGSALYLPPNKGGFFHYVLVTVNGKEITYQVIPLLEKIELPKIFQAKAGAAIPLNAVGIAPDELVRFPLKYPAAVEWEVLDPQVARIDAATGTLYALKPGETEITARSGGISASAQVTVTR